jgi:hypothetical protein
VNGRVSHHRVVLGVLRDSQTPVHRPHTSVQTLGCARIRCTRRVRAHRIASGVVAIRSTTIGWYRRSDRSTSTTHTLWKGVYRSMHRPLWRPHTRMCSDQMHQTGVIRSSNGNGYSVMVSAESHGLVNGRVSHHRVVLGVLRDAQTPVHRPHTSVQTLGCARIRRCTIDVCRGGARSNGYSAMVSAESHGLENERMPHHLVVLGVLRDAQTSASRSHKSVQTLECARIRCTRRVRAGAQSITVIQ